MDYRYADAHCDTAYEMLVQGCALQDNPLHISLNKASSLSNYIQVFAAWTSDKLRGAKRAEEFYRIADNFKKEAAKNENRMSLCLESGDIDRALSAGKTAAVLAIEGGGALNGELDAIPRVYDAGVRMMTLTWNGENELGCGQPLPGGLTGFGRDALRLLEDTGILIDVSHLSDKGFWEVASLARRPFLASHSNLRAVCPHPRNLTDDQFKELARRGGICGVNLCPAFLNEDGRAGFEDIERHIDRFLSLGGEKSIVMGADFDGVDDLPGGISGLSSIPSLIDYFLSRGYPKKLIDMIFFENLKGFLCRSLTSPAL